MQDEGHDGDAEAIARTHWLTDFFCDSVPLALNTGAWLFHTPLADKVTNLATGLVEGLRLMG